jgi:DNA-binding transcriptional LysR family regulator
MLSQLLSIQSYFWIIDIQDYNIRKIDLNLLTVFDVLFDERNVSRAADRLALTQPTVSGMLKKLRSMFDDELFVRTSHGILPTPRAEELATPIKELIADAQNLMMPEAFDPEDAEFTVRLCGSDFVQHTILAELANEVLKRAPNARVSILPRPAAGLADQLARGEFDLSVSIKDVAVPDLPARLLYRDHYVCLSTYAGMTTGMSMSLDKVCQYRHAFVDPTGGTFRGPIDEALRAKHYNRNVVLAVSTFAGLFALMRKEPLLAFVPERVARSLGGEFAVVEVDLDVPPLEIVANWHARMNKDPRHIWLRQTLYAIAKNPGEYHSPPVRQ